MRFGLLAAALAAALAPPAVAADPPVVFQTQPVGRFLNDARAVAGLIGGDDAVKAFNDGIKRKLGEKGYEGLDLNRPVVGYVDVPADPKQSVAVVAVPVSDEKSFLDFCERLTGTKPKALADGLYEVPPPGPDAKAVMRIADGYAFIAAAATDPARALGPKALVPTARLYDPADPALMTGRVYVDRFPKEVRAKAAELLEEFKKGMAGAKLPPDADAVGKLAGEEFTKLATRYIDLSKGAKELALRVNVDPATADLTTEFSLTPVAGSPLATLLGGVKPTTNKFAGLLTPDTVGGFVSSVPLFAEEVRTVVAGIFEAARKPAGNGVPQPGKALADEVLKGLSRTAKAGDMDLALALRGPAKDGTFTGVFALAFDDPSKVEKELKTLVDGMAPDEFKNLLKWDAEKANGVGIHTVDLSKLPAGAAPGPVVTLFGEKAVFAFAFAPKGVYAAVGPDAAAVVKAALAVKPAEAPVLNVAVNPDRAAKLAGAFDPGAAAMVAKVLGKDDKLVPALSLSVAGGKELTVKYGMSLRLFGGAAGFAWLSAPAASPAP